MVLEVKGWKLLYHPIFGDHYIALRNEVRELREKLTPAEFARHPQVKLVAAIRRAITEIIPDNPNRPDFWLSANLSRFRRVKGYGIPDRYRLYYVFSERAKTVIVLYLNDSSSLRKQGAKTDPYAIFADLVKSGVIGKNFEENRRQWEKARKRGGRLAQGEESPKYQAD